MTPSLQDRLPLCSCAEFYSEHPPDCPTRRLFEAKDARIAELEREAERVVSIISGNERIREQQAATIAALQARVAEARELLERSDVAMGNWFSNEFDGGAQFSELTGDIPKWLATTAQEGKT